LEAVASLILRRADDRDQPRRPDRQRGVRDIAPHFPLALTHAHTGRTPP
jgi:hypothetical protein